MHFLFAPWPVENTRPTKESQHKTGRQNTILIACCLKCETASVSLVIRMSMLKSAQKQDEGDGGDDVNQSVVCVNTWHDIQGEVAVVAV